MFGRMIQTRYFYPMRTGIINQEVIINTTPEEAWELFMDADKHSDITGAEVEMSREIEGTFVIFDGYCHGYNIELVPGKRIVQAWHFEEDGWPEDHYSICIFVFETHPMGTRLIFTQTGIPEHKVKALESGWNEYYWEAIKDYLAS